MARLRPTPQERTIIAICAVYALALFAYTMWLLIDGIGP